MFVLRASAEAECAILDCNRDILSPRVDADLAIGTVVEAEMLQQYRVVNVMYIGCEGSPQFPIQGRIGS